MPNSVNFKLITNMWKALCSAETDFLIKLRKSRALNLLIRKRKFKMLIKCCYKRILHSIENKKRFLLFMPFLFHSKMSSLTYCCYVHSFFPNYVQNKNGEKKTGRKEIKVLTIIISG